MQIGSPSIQLLGPTCQDSVSPETQAGLTWPASRCAILVQRGIKQLQLFDKAVLCFLLFVLMAMNKFDDDILMFTFGKNRYVTGRSRLDESYRAGKCSLALELHANY